MLSRHNNKSLGCVGAVHMNGSEFCVNELNHIRSLVTVLPVGMDKDINHVDVS